MEKYPHALRVTPTPVIALLGQGSFQSKLKTEIASRGALKPLCYDLDDPIAFSNPPKRLTYEGYVAKGILKANWMHKMVNVHASAVTIIIPWCDKEGKDEKGRPWHTREPDLLQAVVSIQRRLQHLRSTNHIVFLIVLPKGLSLQETSCTEKIGFFRKKIEFSEKYFFFLSENDIETTALNPALIVLKELSHTYYLEEARRLKKEKALLSRKMQPLVYIRDYWKVAFLSEFRNDTHGMIKYYQSAYGYLRDVPKDHLFEAKIIADYTNFKLCSIYLKKYGVPEAVDQFQKHMKNYKKFRSLSLKSEHWGWVSRQYQVLGELLQEFAPPALWLSTNPSYNHPAYYFHCASSFAIKRRENAADSVQHIKPELLEAYKNLPPLHLANIDMSKQAYVGQIPNEKTEYEAGEARELSYDEWSIARRSIREFNIPHSHRIIDLLLKAHSLYSTRNVSAKGGKKERSASSCKRIKLLIIFEIAEECFHSGDYVKAKEYHDVLRDSIITHEKWDRIAVAFFQRNLDCAKKLKNTEDMIRVCLWLCQPGIPLSVVDQRTIQAQLLYTMYHLDQFELPNLPSPLIYRNVEQVMRCKCRFETKEVATGSSLVYTIEITSLLPLPIRCTMLHIECNQLEYNQTVEDNENFLTGNEDVEVDENSLILLPNQPRAFTFTKRAEKEHIGLLEFKRIELKFGREAEAPVHFVWDSFQPSLEFLEESTSNGSFTQQSSIKITPPKPQVTLEFIHLSPALVGEYYRIRTRIINSGGDIDSGTLTFADTSKDQSCQFFTSTLEAMKDQSLPIEPILCGEEKEISIFVLAPLFNEAQEIRVRLEYRTEGFDTYVVEAFSLPIILALSSRCALFSSEYVPCNEVTGNSTTIRSGEDWTMRVEVRNNCPYPIEVVNASLNLNENAICIRSTSADLFRPDNPCVLRALDKLTSWFTIRPIADGSDVSIGKFEFTWKRAPHPNQLAGWEEDNERVIKTPTLIPLMTIEKFPFRTKVDAPARVQVGIPFPCLFEITNNTTRTEELAFSMTESSAFLFAGCKASSFKILPNQSYQFSSNLVPLKSGKVALPAFHVACKRLSQQITSAKQKHFLFSDPPEY